MFRVLEVREDWIRIVDQRDIQKHGGLYVKYPSSAIVTELLEMVKANVVLDSTYGEGRFYAIKKPRVLIGIDPVVRDWVVKPDLFIPFENWKAVEIVKKLGIKADVVVCDPPWGKNFRKRTMYDYTVKPEIIIQYALKLAEVARAKYFLLHYKWPLDLGFKPIKVIEFNPISRYLNQSDPFTFFVLYKVR